MGYRIVYAVALLIFFSSCQKVPGLKNLANVKMDLPFSQEYSAPGVDSNIQLPPGGMSYTFPAQTVATNSEETLQKYNVSKDQIVKMNLKSFTQYIYNAPDGFNFADTLQVYLSAPGMPEVLMAYKNYIPKNVDSLVFDCTDENLKDYVLQDTIYMRMKGHFNSVPKAASYKSNFTFGTVTSLLKDE